MDVVNLPENTNNTTTITKDPDADADADIPLNFNLNVRGPDNTNKNSFIYGERGILLIAGIGKFHPFIKTKHRLHIKFIVLFSASFNRRSTPFG